MTLDALHKELTGMKRTATAVLAVSGLGLITGCMLLVEITPVTAREVLIATSALVLGFFAGFGTATNISVTAAREAVATDVRAAMEDET